MNAYLEFEKPVAELETRIAELRAAAEGDDVDISNELQRLELSNGRRGGTLAIAQGHQAKLLEWDATVTGTGGFFSWDMGNNLQGIAAYWEVEQGLVICVAFGIDNIDIYPQAKNMIESVKT